ncbi:MAG: M23 family metallopeptidase [Leptospiraceae bacterium]|nr:M23 family metallopeptidase [Leptospiraceae bacterium]MDW8307504.1 M23 family metallopeptidase [Leptospiraceae bacterium]
MYGGLTFEEVFGIRSGGMFLRNLLYAIPRSLKNQAFQVDISSLGFLRPDLSIPAYLGIYPRDRLAPIYHLFDRTGGGKRYSHRITRRYCRDYRGQRLTYDEHNGVDFVCPPGTPICAAAAGHVVYIRRRFLRGGTTLIIDHGYGLVTHYTHIARPLKKIGDFVRTGEEIAISGAQGMDMTLFFPWIPPHLHFTVFFQGRPVDPFLAPQEEDRPGTWARRNDPRPQQVVPKEPEPPFSEVNEEVIAILWDKVSDGEIRREMEQVRGNNHALAALLEDSLLHDELLWPEEVRSLSLRMADSASLRKAQEIKLYLPLSASLYDGAKIADEFEIFSR